MCVYIEPSHGIVTNVQSIIFKSDLYLSKKTNTVKTSDFLELILS